MNIGPPRTPLSHLPGVGRTSYHPTDVAEGYCAHCHAFTRNHLPRIPPHTVPGALYMRIVSDTGVVLSEHPMVDVEMARLHSEEDVAITGAWRDVHGGRVYVYVYDGDTGKCLQTLVVSE